MAHPRCGDDCRNWIQASKCPGNDSAFRIFIPASYGDVNFTGGATGYFYWGFNQNGVDRNCWKIQQNYPEVCLPVAADVVPIDLNDEDVSLTIKWSTDGSPGSCSNCGEVEGPIDPCLENPRLCHEEYFIPCFRITLCPIAKAVFENYYKIYTGTSWVYSGLFDPDFDPDTDIYIEAYNQQYDDVNAATYPVPTDDNGSLDIEDLEVYETRYFSGIAYSSAFGGVINGSLAFKVTAGTGVRKISSYDSDPNYGPIKQLILRYRYPFKVDGTPFYYGSCPETGYLLTPCAATSDYYLQFARYDQYIPKAIKDIIDDNPDLTWPSVTGIFGIYDNRYICYDVAASATAYSTDSILVSPSQQPSVMSCGDCPTSEFGWPLIRCQAASTLENPKNYYVKCTDILRLKEEYGLNTLYFRVDGICFYLPLDHISFGNCEDIPGREIPIDGVIVYPTCGFEDCVSCNCGGEPSGDCKDTIGYPTKLCSGQKNTAKAPRIWFQEGYQPSKRVIFRYRAWCYVFNPTSTPRLVPFEDYILRAIPGEMYTTCHVCMATADPDCPDCPDNPPEPPDPPCPNPPCGPGPGPNPPPPGPRPNPCEMNPRPAWCDPIPDYYCELIPCEDNGGPTLVIRRDHLCAILGIFPCDPSGTVIRLGEDCYTIGGCTSEVVGIPTSIDGAEEVTDCESCICATCGAYEYDEDSATVDVTYYEPAPTADNGTNLSANGLEFDNETAGVMTFLGTGTISCNGACSGTVDVTVTFACGSGLWTVSWTDGGGCFGGFSFYGDDTGGETGPADTETDCTCGSTDGDSECGPRGIINADFGTC